MSPGGMAGIASGSSGVTRTSGDNLTVLRDERKLGTAVDHRRD